MVTAAGVFVITNSYICVYVLDILILYTLLYLYYIYVCMLFMNMVLLGPFLDGILWRSK